MFYFIGLARSASSSSFKTVIGLLYSMVMGRSHSNTRNPVYMCATFIRNERHSTDHYLNLFADDRGRIVHSVITDRDGEIVCDNHIKLKPMITFGRYYNNGHMLDGIQCVFRQNLKTIYGNAQHFKITEGKELKIDNMIKGITYTN